MHCIQLRHAEKPAGVNAHDEDDETEQLLDDTFKINGETFHMPEDAIWKTTSATTSAGTSTSAGETGYV